MIKASDAIAAARAMIGTPYSELDCINLIKKIIRTAPGGDPNYTTAGTDELWSSYKSSGKYKHLTWRQEGICDAEPGMLAFKGRPSDKRGDGQPHHVGLVADKDGRLTVIHASSANGKVVETPLEAGQGWTLLAKHKLIQTQERRVAKDAIERNPPNVEGLVSSIPAKGRDNLAERRGPCALDPGQEPGQSRPTGASCQPQGRVAKYKAAVNTANGPLNLRKGPGKEYGVIAALPKGTEVTVLKRYPTGWAYVTSEEAQGYVSEAFLAVLPPVQDEPGTANEAELIWCVNVPCRNREQAEALADLIPGAIAVVSSGND